MRLIFLIKILFAISCVYISLRSVSINESIDNLINEQYSALGKLRGNPTLDTAENRKRYLERKTEINKQIASLSRKRYPTWYKYIGLILGMIGSYLVKDITSTLFKKKPLNRIIVQRNKA